MPKSENNEIIKQYFSKINCRLTLISSILPEEHISYLQEIFSCHIQMFPFHNFELREASHSHPLVRKHLVLFKMDSYVKGYSGGFCFQSAGILYQALKHVGFNAYLSIGKVLNGLSADSLEAKKIPATHLIVLVNIGDQKYLLDPSMGMNGHCLPFLILDNTESIYKQNNQDFKINFENNEIILYRKIKEEWTTAFCSSLVPANIQTIKSQLTKLEYFPLTLGIRDGITLVGIATPSGGKSLLWKMSANEFTLKIIDSSKPDYERCFDNPDEAYRMICDDFKIEHISKLDFRKYCSEFYLSKAIKHTDVNFPIDENEVKKMRKNYRW